MRSRADAAPAYLYVPDLGEPGATLELPADESHYVARVCRAHAGDHATATDGTGGVAMLRVLEAGRSVTAEVVSLERLPPGRRATVWCGPPEGTRADWLVEKLAELGVLVWQPIECRRGSWESASRRRERWQRLAIAGMRQARRRHRMEVREPVGLDLAIAGLGTEDQRWLATARGVTTSRPRNDLGQVGAIGPAGGFTDEEEASLEASGFAPISLSDARLRSETAALAWAVWSSMG